jgi:hypothetical protein
MLIVFTGLCRCLGRCWLGLGEFFFPVVDFCWLVVWLTLFI